MKKCVLLDVRSLVVFLFVAMASLTFLSTTTTASPTPTLRTAIIVYEAKWPATMTFTNWTSNLTMYLSTAPPYNRAHYLGTILTIERENAAGGVRGMLFDPIVYNSAFSLSSGALLQQFVLDVVNGPHAPLWITTPLAVSSVFDEMAVLVATECDRTGTCMVAPTSTVKSLFVCTQTEIDLATPECVGRLGARRFNSMVSFLPNSDYIAESFIGYMAHEKHTNFALLAFEGSFVDWSFAVTPLLAETAGLNLVYQNLVSSTSCTPGNISLWVDSIRNAGTQSLAIIGANNAAGVCIAALLEYTKQISYFPSSLGIMGGSLVAVNGILTAKGHPEMLEYIYGIAPFDPATRGPGWTAQTVPGIHTEAYSATRNMSSTGVFYDALLRRFGNAELANSYISYANFGAGGQTLPILILEASGGSLDGRVWQATRVNNAPSFLGFIEFDATGQDAGARIQLLTQFYDPNTDSARAYAQAMSVYPPSPIGIASYPSSRGADVDPPGTVYASFPSAIVASNLPYVTSSALNWPDRLIRLNFLTGDHLVIVWDDLFVFVGAAVLAISDWSGLFRLGPAVAQFDTNSGKFQPKQLAIMAMSRAVSGTWACLFLSTSQIQFKPVESSVIHATADIEIPLSSFVESAVIGMVILLVSDACHLALSKRTRALARKSKYATVTSSETAATTRVSISHSSSDNGMLGSEDTPLLPSKHLVTFGVDSAWFEDELVFPMQQESPPMWRRAWRGIVRFFRTAWYGSKLYGRRLFAIQLRASFMLLLTAIMWTGCGLFQVAILLNSLSSTHTRPDLDANGERGVVTVTCAAIVFASLVINWAAISVMSHVNANVELCTVMLAGSQMFMIVELFNTIPFVYHIDSTAEIVDLPSLLFSVVFIAAGGITVSIMTSLALSGNHVVKFAAAYKSSQAELGLATKSARCSMQRMAEKLLQAERDTVIERWESATQICNDARPRVGISNENARVLATWLTARTKIMNAQLTELAERVLPAPSEEQVDKFIRSSVESLHDSVTNSRTGGSRPSKNNAATTFEVYEHLVLRAKLKAACTSRLTPENYYIFAALRDHIWLSADVKNAKTSAAFIWDVFCQGEAGIFQLNLSADGSAKLEAALLSPTPVVSALQTSHQAIADLLQTNELHAMRSDRVYADLEKQELRLALNV